MTRDETLKIMAVLKATYPNFYKDMTRRDAEGVVALWTDMFSEDSYNAVAAAVKAFIASDSKGFPGGGAGETARHGACKRKGVARQCAPWQREGSGVDAAVYQR